MHNFAPICYYALQNSQMVQKCFIALALPSIFYSLQPLFDHLFLVALFHISAHNYLHLNYLSPNRFRFYPMIPIRFCRW